MRRKKAAMTLLSSISSSAVLLFLSLPAAHADQTFMTLAKENYLQADVDGDLMLTLDEFTKFVDLNANDGLGRAGMIRDRGMHGFAFRRVDLNSDGLVAPDELSAMAR